MPTDNENADLKMTNLSAQSADSILVIFSWRLKKTEKRFHLAGEAVQKPVLSRRSLRALFIFILFS